MRETIRINTGSQTNALQPMIRLTRAKSRDTWYDLIVAHLRAVEDIQNPDGQTLGAMTALQVDGLPEAVLVRETADEVYDLLSEVGITFSRAQFRA
jgi:hypothetical protein